MRIEFLLEEASAEAALRNLLPRMVGQSHEFGLHVFNGKNNLLSRLPRVLKGYRSWLPKDSRILVLIDEDRQDCHALKARIETAATQAGFLTKTVSGARRSFQVLNRLAVEELEAWFLGDIEALVTAYPRVPKTLGCKRGYKNPDGITGGTWEALERVLMKAGYYPTGLSKIEAARNISKHMDPERNMSKSFKVFKEGLQALLRQPT